MAEFTLPGGAPRANIGTTEPVSRSSIPSTKPLEWNREPAPDAADYGYATPTENAAAAALANAPPGTEITSTDLTQQLAAAQVRARKFPPPEQAVQLREKAADQGIPYTLAIADPKVVEDSSTPYTPLWSDYATNKPLADVLIDPNTSVLTHDEAHKLAKLAELDKQGFSQNRLGQQWEMGSLSVERDSLMFNRAVNGGVSTPEDAARLEVIDQRLALLPSSESTGGQILEGIVQQGPQMLRMAKAAGAGAAALGVPALAAGLEGAAVMGPIGARLGVLADNTMRSIGNVYGEITGLGIPHAAALPAAVIGGAIIGGLDALSFGVLAKFPGLKMLPKIAGIEKLTAENIRPALVAAMKDSHFLKLSAELLKDIGSEGSTEYLQEWVQVLSDYAANAKAGGQYQTPTFKEASDRALMAGVVGGLAGGVYGSVGTVAHELVGKVAAGEQSKPTIDHLYDVTEGLKTAERAPDVLEKYANELAKEGPIKYLTMPVEDLDKLLATAKENPALKAWLERPETDRQLSLARSSGARVTVPLGDFVAYIRPLDTARTLNQVIGLNDEMSPAEARELKPAVQKARKEMADIAKREEFIANSPEALIVTDLEKKLLAVGKTAAAAKIQAELVASGVATLARRAGKDPWETYRAAPITISNVTHENSLTKSLEQADPKDVKSRLPDGSKYLLYEHPESPIQLRVTEEDVFGTGKASRVVGVLGFSDKVRENVISLKEYGNKGYSTSLYLKAIGDAQKVGLGFASDAIRTEATERMYARLKEIGVPVEKRDSDIGSVYYIPPERLAKTDLNAAWEKLLARNVAGVTPAEIEKVVSGIQELRQNQKGEVRGRITFDPSKRDWFNITLTGKANLSTFLHESAHYLLEIMRKLALENPSADLTTDLKALEKWAGVVEGQEWSDAALEKFARGMETYFGEGKAPSAKLASAFATFKTWILHVYKTLMNLHAPLTDEVRSVMDRMLATSEEINARQQELGYFPNEILLREGDMTPAEQAQYRSLYEKGAQQAQAALDKETINAFRKEKTAEYKRIGTEMEQELDTHPVIALRSWLAGEGRTDGGLAPDVNGTKFDRELVPERLRSKLKEHIADIGGTDPSEIAPYFGFKNGPAMLDSLATTPARSTLKSAMVKAEMTRRYPAYGPDKAWVEKAALEQLHESDAVSNALEIELRVLYKKANLQPPNSPALVAQQAARSAVTEMSRKEMRPNQWRTAETKLLREQQKALAAKDFRTAADLTRRRLFNRAMWQEVQTAAAKVDAAEKYVRRYANTDAQARLGRSSDMNLPTGERVGSVVRDAVVSLVEGTGLAEQGAASQMTFDAHVTKLEEQGLPVSVDPTLRERPLKKWEDLTFMEAMAVQDAVKNLNHVARDLNTIRMNGKAVELNTIADAVDASLAESGLLNHLGQKGEKNSRVRGARSDIVKPETIAIDIDGGKIGAFHKAFIQSAEEGQFANDKRKGQRREEIRALAKEYAPDDWAKQVKKTHVFSADGREYTGGEVFAMLLNYGTESNRRKLVEGMKKAGLGWSNERVLAFIHEVFPDRKVYDFAQAIINYVNRPDLWEDSARVREAIAGVRPDKVEALPIPTPDGGEIAGGYYHLIYDNKVPLREAEATQADALNAMHEANPLNLYAANGFTKGRTGYVAPLLLDPAAFAAHIYEVDHFITNAQGIIDRHKLLQHPRIKKAIIHALGHEYWMALKGANNFIATDGQKLTREVLQMSRGLDTLLYHNALLTMGGNVLSGLNQVVTGIPATLAYLGPKGLPSFAKALIEFTKSPFQTWADVAKQSGEVEGMSFHYDRDLRLVVGSEISGDHWSDIRSRIAATTMSPVVFGQKLVNVITWKAAYNVALAEGMQGADVIAHANSVVRQSQSASAPKDFTTVQRSHDGLVRILTSLASYQFTLNDMVMPRHLTPKQLAGSLSRVTMLLLTGAMAKALFAAVLPRLEEKDAQDRKGLEKMAADSEVPGLLAVTQSMMDILGNVPIVGRPVESIVSGREPRYASWVDTMVRSTELASKLLEDKGFTKSDVRAVTETVGLAAGIPTRHIFFAPGEFIYELMDGNIEDNPWSFFQELALVRPGHKGEK